MKLTRKVDSVHRSTRSTSPDWCLRWTNPTYLIGSEPKTTPLQLKAAIALSACENETNKSSETQKRKGDTGKQIVGQKYLETCVSYNP